MHFDDQFETAISQLDGAASLHSSCGSTAKSDRDDLSEAHSVNLDASLHQDIYVDGVHHVEERVMLYVSYLHDTIQDSASSALPWVLMLTKALGHDQ